jgi:hypothetical protein
MGRATGRKLPGRVKDQLVVGHALHPSPKRRLASWVAAVTIQKNSGAIGNMSIV